MEIIYNVWLAFNIIFGLWSSRNWLIYLYACCANRKYNQSSMGTLFDLIVPVSVLSFLFTFH
jgi:hypothetical protein